MAAFFGVFLFASPSIAQSTKGRLEHRAYSEFRGTELRYRCRVGEADNEKSIQISLQLASNYLQVDLDGDVRIRGIASETLDRKTGTTHYFLQGGSAPLFQRLTLAVREEGKWARFTKTFGADAIICE